MKKIPLLIDCDTGVDDAVAIVCALQYKEVFDIKAITAVAGNVPLEYTAKNSLNLVDMLGRNDIPVAKGADKPLTRELKRAISHGNTGLGDVVIPNSSRAFTQESASELIYKCACENEGELVILATGPQTNMAIALKAYPDLASKIKKVYIMGGSLIGGNMTQAAEFNAFVDPEAMKILFEAGIETVMVGLDITLQLSLPHDIQEQLESIDSKAARFVHDIFDFNIRYNTEMGWDDPAIHDVAAFCSMVAPELFTTVKHYVDVETEGTITRGMTVADFRNVCPDKEKNVICATDIDVDGFWKWFIETIRRSSES
ncbi:MAG: nucleoside hydrolase [Longicatena sp.]